MAQNKDMLNSTQPNSYTNAVALAKAEGKGRPVHISFSLGGFTLVELSIVIVIIGLIVAGITAGQSLSTSAKHRKFISAANQYRASYFTFKAQYDAIPGDMNDSLATKYWPNSRGGNGNRQVNRYTNCGASTTPPANATTSRETTRFWEHLNLAGLIPGSLHGHLINNIYAAGSLPEIVPTIFNEVLWLAAWGNPHSSNAIGFLKLNNNDAGNHYIFTAQEAKAIDTKSDDGNPRWGLTFALPNSGQCLGGANDVYQLSNTGLVCDIWMHME